MWVSSSAWSEREGAVLDNALHDKGRGQSLHSRQSGDRVVVEPLEGWEISCDDSK